MLDKVRKRLRKAENAKTKGLEKVKGLPSVFVKRKRTFTLGFLLVIALFVVSSIITEYDVIGGFESVPTAI
jgi:hypothetical protein